MKPRLLLAFLILSTLVLGLWLWLRNPAPADVTNDNIESPRQPSDTAGESPGPTGDAPSPGVSTERSSLPDASGDDPGQGQLKVTVHWADATPAPDISLVLRYTSPGSMYFPVAEQRSGETGVAVFRDLRPGEVGVRTDRTADWRSKRATIVAGETTELTLTLKKGFDVEVKVVDEHGTGVADARVWMSRKGRRDWLGGTIVGQTRADGTLHLRAAPMGASLGALYPHRSPSDLFDLDDAYLERKPLQVKLELGPPGASLSGRILDSAGEPVAGADICLGTMPGRFTQRARPDSHKEAWTPLTTHSQEDGGYSFPGVAPGKHPLAVRKAGFAIQRAEVELSAGSKAVHDVTLTPGFTLTGTVLDANGKPSAKARVQAFERPFKDTYVQSGQYDYEDVYPHLYAHTDAAGHYRMDHIPPGERLIYANEIGSGSMGRISLYAKTTITGAEGETLRWDPQITGGLQIHGVAVFRDGQPMNRHFVIATRSKTGKQHVGNTDKEGKFRFIHLDPVGYTVRVQMWNAPKGTAPLQKHNVVPGPGELRLVAEYDGPKKKVTPGSVKGRIDDTSGRIARKETLKVVLQTSRGSRTGDNLEGNAFHFKGLQPGRYKVVARAGERIIYVGEFFDLTAGQHLDLGALQTVPGGSLKLILRAPEAATKISLRGVWLRAPETTASQAVTIKPRDTLRIDNLMPGTHRLSAAGPNVMLETADVTVIAGQVAEHEMTLRPAVPFRLHFHFATDPPPGHLAYVIRDSADRVIRERTLTHGSFLASPAKLLLLLEKGNYRLEVSTKSGLSAHTSIDVPELVEERQELTVRLK